MASAPSSLVLLHSYKFVRVYEAQYEPVHPDRTQMHVSGTAVRTGEQGADVELYTVTVFNISHL